MFGERVFILYREFSKAIEESSVFIKVKSRIFWGRVLKDQKKIIDFISGAVNFQLFSDKVETF